MYIAEQQMVAAAVGMQVLGWKPFCSTFAAFLSRAYDFVRMAAVSRATLALCGSHAGVSIGEDGPSQMGLEDLAMMAAQPGFTVLYPSDATSAWNATCLAAENAGGYYLRIGRPNAPVLYGPEEQFRVGKGKVLRKSDEDKAVVVGAGVTLFEALKAYDRLKEEGIAVRVIDLFSVKPIDEEGLREAAHAAGGIVVTVEDHYEHGGIGDAVLSALAGEGAKVYKLAVKEVARSGKPEELLDKFGISASHIVTAVKEALGR
jgi:transketolase